MPDAASGLSLRNATVRLGTRLVLDALTIDLTEARIGILGRNGSGKTTLLRLLAGLIAPDQGTVRVDGIDPFKDRKATLSALGILFQNPDHQILFPTVAEELAFGLRQQGLPAPEAKARVAALLEAEGRGHWAGAAVATLSQGQKQWLSLMAVLLMGPGTLLLDEPFAALDLPMQDRLARRLAALPQRIITISHDPAAVAGCDRVIWLEGGALVADGPPDTVLPRFRAEMTRIGAADADTDLTL